MTRSSYYKRRRQEAQLRLLTLIGILLTLIAGIIIAICLFGKPFSNDTTDIADGTETQEPATETIAEEPDTAGTEAISTEPDVTDTEADNAVAESTEEIITGTPIEGFDFSNPVPYTDPVAESYFDDAVFIGDSQTDGMIINTGLVNAIPYVHKGLTVDTLYTKPVINLNGSKLSVMDALAQTEFKKVYIMLGINETGWIYSDIFIEKYGKVIDDIKAINPSAIIYIQEIFPVSAKVSSTHSFIRNSKITEYNELIKTMAEEKQIFFIDTTSAITTVDGALPEDAAVDGIHFKKPYYLDWLDYLKTHTIRE